MYFRYYVTKDNVMYMASEVGVVDENPENIIRKGRLKPGRMLLVDTKEKIFMKDEVLKKQMANHYPVAQWLKEVNYKMLAFLHLSH